MPDLGMLREFLGGGRVDAAVFALWPDYRAMLLAVGGVVPGPSDQASDAVLQAAEAAAGEALRGRAIRAARRAGLDNARDARVAARRAPRQDHP